MATYVQQITLRRQYEIDPKPSKGAVLADLMTRVQAMTPPDGFEPVEVDVYEVMLDEKGALTRVYND
jgi:hypothetical protein